MVVQEGKGSLQLVRRFLKLNFILQYFLKSYKEAKQIQTEYSLDVLSTYVYIWPLRPLHSLGYTDTYSLQSRFYTEHSYDMSCDVSITPFCWCHHFEHTFE